MFLRGSEHKDYLLYTPGLPNFFAEHQGMVDEVINPFHATVANLKRTAAVWTRWADTGTTATSDLKGIDIGKTNAKAQHAHEKGFFTLICV